MSVHSKMTAIADAIRSKTGGTEKLGLDAMATEVDTVYNKGYQDGYDEGYQVGYDEGEIYWWGDGYEEGYLEGKAIGYEKGYAEGNIDGYASGLETGKAQGIEEGKQAEHDAFWDALQQNGARTSYQWAFATVWTADMFRPKYDLIPTTLNTAFHSFNGPDLDMVERLNECGVTLDTSRCTNFASAFMWAKIKRLGVFDLTAATALSNTFAYGSIETIDQLIVKPENSFSNVFASNTALKNITFDGTIGNDLSFQWQSALTRDSIESIISCLSDTTQGKTLTLSQTAVDNAFGLEYEDSGTEQWQALVDSKPNWSIVLQ